MSGQLLTACLLRAPAPTTLRQLRSLDMCIHCRVPHPKLPTHSSASPAGTQLICRIVIAPAGTSFEVQRQLEIPFPATSESSVPELRPQARMEHLTSQSHRSHRRP